MLKLPLICANGIGDSFLILGRVPIGILGKLGFRFNIFYTTPEHPARKILEPFFRGIRYCDYTSGAPSPREKWVFSKMLSLSMRTAKIWRPPYGQSGKQKSNGSRKKILLHTHLDGHHGWKGATAKMWPLENWVEFCRKLHDDGWEVWILEWDSNSRLVLFRECPFLHDGRLSTDIDTFQSFSEYNCLFSVDSWSKYVAAWYGLPQVVVVPDLRVGYCGFENVSADEFVGWWMHGILNKKEVRILGLEKRGGRYQYCLRSLNELEVKSAMELIREVS